MSAPDRLVFSCVVAVLLAWTAAAQASRPTHEPEVPLRGQGQGPPPRRAAPSWLEVSPGVTTRRDAVRIVCAEATWPECAREEEVTLSFHEVSPPGTAPASPPGTAPASLPGTAPASEGTVRLTRSSYWGRASVQVRDPHSGDGRPLEEPLGLVPGAEITLVARSRLAFAPGCAAHHGCSGGAHDDQTPIEMRHPLLVNPPYQYWVTYVDVADAPEAEVTITYPASWSIDTDFLSASGHPPPTVATTSQGAMTKTVRVPAGAASAVSVERSIKTGLARRLGGPLVGVGSDFRVGDRPSRLALRAGYEVASTSYLLHSLTVDTNFKRVVVAPAIEAVLGGSWLNTVSIGLGMPVRVADGAGVGARGQVSLQLSFVGLVQTVDYYPVRAGGSELYTVASYGQMTF